MANPKPNQKVMFTVVFTRPDGSPGTVDGIPVWSSSDELVGIVRNIGADGLSAEMHGVGVAGSATMMVKADADLGAGVREVELSAVVIFEDTEVNGGVLTASEPMDI